MQWDVFYTNVRSVPMQLMLANARDMIRPSNPLLLKQAQSQCPYYFRLSNSLLGKLTQLRQSLNPQIKSINQFIGFEKQLKNIAAQMASGGQIEESKLSAITNSILSMNEMLTPLAQGEAVDSQNIARMTQEIPGIIQELTTALGQPAQPGAGQAAPDPNAVAQPDPNAVAQPDPNAVAQPDPNAVAQPGLGQEFGRAVDDIAGAAGDAGRAVGRGVGNAGRAVGRGIGNFTRNVGNMFRSPQQQASSSRRILTAGAASARQFVRV